MIDPAVDARIDATHRAAERAETDARGIIARLQMVPGVSAWLGRQKRRYGETVNPWRSDQANLSIQAAILQHDLPLAHYLSREAGVSLPAADDAKIERERQREASVARMQAETEAMRQRNQQVRQRHQHEQTYGRRNPFTSQWV